MFNIKFCLLALALAVSTVAFAQEKDDMFGQQPTSAGDAPVPQAPRKLSITNSTPKTASGAPDNAASGRRGDAKSDSRSDPRNRLGGDQRSDERIDPKTGRVSIANGPVARKEEPSEFQKFIAENTGQMLPVFGSEFFANAPATFAPIANSPVPADYPLGPGDELMIRGFGTIDIDFRATVDRNGTISIPSIGSIPLAGVKAGDAEAVIRAAVGRLYKGVTLNVTFGQLRAITVYVVGQARRPGTYTVSSLSTLVTALFASGGPNANGSMRRVQVKRAGKVAAELDLYSFIGKGDKSGDIKLVDGDTIYIPPAGGFVALVGKVNSPAVYELKTGTDTIESMLDFAGGLPVVADPRRAFLERISPAKNHPRSVEQFALNADGLKRTLQNGDVLNITSITPDFSNAVVLRGNVDQPVRAPFKSGMRVSDLIPNREYLITRASIRRQNNVIATGDAEKDTTEEAENIAARIGGLIDEINWDYAVVERVDRNDLTVKLIPFNLGNVFSNPNGPDNIQLQPGDTVTIFSQDDVAVPMDKRRVFVRVEGEVKVPGVYQMSAGETLQSLLAKAGGPTSSAYLFGAAFYRESVRKEQQANLEKAANRLETQLRNEQARGIANAHGADAAILESQRQAQMDAAKQNVARFRELKATGRIAFGLDPAERSFARLPQLKLENGDRLVVPARPAFVHVFGAVNVEASPLWRPNTRVGDYLKMAGVTADADPANVFVMRVDGTVVSAESKGWFFGSISGLEVMPGDSIVIPEKMDKETGWTKFVQGTKEWAQIFANFGLGAAAISTLRN
jgi:protein involved in polysaccharide export with SLBB domain